MENMMPYKNILLEIRPRLQSVNVFVNLKSEYTNTSVALDDNCFILILDEKKFKVNCENFKIIKNTLNNFQKNDNFISFRFATDSLNNFGSFKSEFLQSEPIQPINRDNSVYKYLNANMTDNKSFDKNFSIKCGNCFKIFLLNTTFERVLPLPSENMNQSDWFCHAHSKEKFSLQPGIKDLYYSNYYVYLNSSVPSNLQISNKVICCNDCLSSIGVVLDDKTLKIWFNTVLFETSRLKFKPDPRGDIFGVIFNALQDSLNLSLKLILNCQESGEKLKYILLWVLEKKLEISIVNKESQFQNLNVAKVLFKTEFGENELVNKWLRDVNVSCFSISKVMMSEIEKHLSEMHSFIPKNFSNSNDFYISYVAVYGN